MNIETISSKLSLLGDLELFDICEAYIEDISDGATVHMKTMATQTLYYYCKYLGTKGVLPALYKDVYMPVARLYNTYPEIIRAAVSRLCKYVKYPVDTSYTRLFTHSPVNTNFYRVAAEAIAIKI